MEKLIPEKNGLQERNECSSITVVDDTHGHPGENERESGTPELRTPETVLQPLSRRLSVHGLRERNQLLHLRVSQVRSVISGSLLHGGQKILSLPVEDEPVWRLRDEEKDQHAGPADDRDAHQEVLVLIEDFGNQSS